MKNSVNLLLVEDDPADVILTRKALDKERLYGSLAIANDGVDALEMLRGEGEKALSTLPDLILLDLNMPRMNGRELLAELKADDRLRRIPVVVLTTSDAQRDIVGCYELQASCFLSKPVDLQQFTRVIKSIQDFWLTLVRYPDGESV